MPAPLLTACLRADGHLVLLDDARRDTAAFLDLDALPALEALAEYLPLVVIELRAWRGQAEVILVPETVVINQNLDVAGPAGTVSGEARSEADWEASITPEAWAFHNEFIAWTRSSLGEVRVDYSPHAGITFAGPGRERRRPPLPPG